MRLTLARTCRLSRALSTFRARQFADGGVDQVEGLAGFERDLDLPALAVGEVLVASTRSTIKPDPADVRTHGADEDE